MTPFEQSLSALSPSRGGLDRDRLMYEAGRRSALERRKRDRAWPAVAAGLAGLSIGQFWWNAQHPRDADAPPVLAAKPNPTPRPIPSTADEEVVILVRRPPELRPDDFTGGQRGPRLLQPRELDAFVEPPILAASARLGPLPEGPSPPLTARDGRVAEAFANMGDSL